MPVRCIVRSPAYVTVTSRESLAQSRILRKSELTTRMINYACTHRGVQMISHPISNTLENDRPQHDRTAACVIAQQYSSVTVSLRFHSRKEKFGVRAKFKKSQFNYL